MSASLDFIDRKTKENTPWFVYFNPTRMHVWTHLKPKSQGKTGHGIYPDGMVELDGYVGQLLKKLDDLGIADNTIVVFTTDNGAEVMSWPDGGTTPFRGEKATNWEGGYRVPTVIRWPGMIKPGTVYNDVFSHYDLIPTFAAAGGNPNIVEQVRKGAQIGDKTFKVHLDGYNLMPFFKGKRRTRAGSSSTGTTTASWSPFELTTGRSFSRSRITRASAYGRTDFTNLRMPKLFELRADPFERGDESILYDKWMADRAFVQVPAQAFVGAVAGELQGVSDSSEAGFVQSGQRDGEAVTDEGAG